MKKLMILVAGVAMVSSAVFADGMTPQQVAKAFVDNMMNCKINAMGKLCTEDSQDYFELNKVQFKKKLGGCLTGLTTTYSVL